MAQSEIKIRSLVHKETGLVVAFSDDIPGFIVHAHSDEEMAAKLGREYEAYIKATTGESVRVNVRASEPMPGYGPAEYVASPVVLEAA